MPIKWKLQDFFVADFLSHLVETETELSLSHVVVGSVLVEKGPVVVRRFRSHHRIMDGWMTGRWVSHE
jgi:hypothetical protein